MSATDDKGKFSADISQRVIEEALRSVESAAAHEVQIPTEESEVPAPVMAVEPSGEAENQLLQAELEASQLMGRETMARLKDTHDRMLRATADLDNYRRRAQKEKDDILRFGQEKLMKDFLPVIDNLDRALEHATSAGDFESLKRGIEMTRKLFEDMLAKHGVSRVSSLGKPFDPRFHEAMQSVDRKDIPANQVVTEVVKGYLLNDRLMRPALVVVSTGRPPAALEATTGGDG